MGVQVILVAGDRGASRAVRGQSKAYVPIAGKPMVVHVLEALLHTPEISEVYVVGDPVPLEKALFEHGVIPLAAMRGRAVHVVPQRDSLYENVWHSFLRTQRPGASDPDHAILVVPADVPLIVPEEISDFLGKAIKADADYVVGLTSESALAPYRPGSDRPGIDVAYFNLREGRVRQNNLHYVRPLRVGNRHYAQDMYENRYQKQAGAMLKLFWRVFRNEYRNLWVVSFYLVMQIAGFLNRRGQRRAADAVRRFASLVTVERGISDLLRTRFASVTTELGGAALDVDNERDLAAAEAMFEVWKERQRQRPALPAA
jgi:GTP:adenosylcobinamide-phosphate guanylyltransferase